MLSILATLYEFNGENFWWVFLRIALHSEALLSMVAEHCRVFLSNIEPFDKSVTLSSIVKANMDYSYSKNIKNYIMSGTKKGTCPKVGV